MVWSIAAIVVLLAADIWGADAIHRHLPQPYGDFTEHAIAVALIVAVFLWVDQLVRRFYWHGYVRRRTGREAPALMRDIVTVALMLIGLSIGLSVEAGLSITGLATASGATAIILGIRAAGRHSGSVQRVGDQSRRLLRHRRLSDGVHRPDARTGLRLRGGASRGVRPSWRLDDGRRLMVPNHLATTNPVMNHSRPREPKRLSVEVVIDNRVPADRVMDMLLGEAFKAARRPRIGALPRTRRRPRLGRFRQGRLRGAVLRPSRPDRSLDRALTMFCAQCWT